MIEEKKDNTLENVGAGWKRLANSGNGYYALVVGGEKFLMFPNKNKKEDKHPDFTIHKKLD